MFLLPALALGLLTAAFRWQAEWWRRAGWALALTAFFAFHTARRLLPPRADVSRLAAHLARRDQPLTAFKAHLVGIIADYPRSSHWTTRFTLEVESVGKRPRSGRVALTLPYNAELEIGDRIEMETDLRPLTRPRNPGERDAFWSSIQAGCWCENGPVLLLQRLQPGARFSLERRVQAVRHALLSRYEALFSGDESERTIASRPFPRQHAALLMAMVWGQSGLAVPLPEQTRADFRAAGLSHLLVASGTQVTVIVLMLFWIARWVRVRRAWLVLFILPCLVAYALVAGESPSILRACICGVLGALGLARGRDLDGLSLWCAALLGLLLLDPALAWSMSLQLTFAAMWGLLVVTPIAFRVLGRLSKGTLAQVVALSLGAGAGTWPLTVLHFGTSSAASVGANLMSFPLAGALIIVGVLGLFLPLGDVLYRLTDAVGAIASGATRPLGALVEGARLPTSWCLACYALLCLATLPFAEEWADLWAGFTFYLTRQASRVAAWNPRIVCVTLALIAGALTWQARRSPPPTLRVTVLDVGQGQCILIQDPSGRAALVDGGSLDGHERADVGATLLVPVLHNLGVSRLDAVFLTSPNEDHCNGLRRVLREIPVGQFVDGPRAAQTPHSDPLDELGQAQLENVRREVQRLGVPAVVPRAGETFSIGATRIVVLNPLLPLGASQNDNSLVLRVEWKARSIVISGDLEAAGEKRLVARASRLHCDALVLSQHGSGTSSSAEWLRAAAPGLAIVSCGRFNRLNDPAPSVLRAVGERHIPLLRTDLDGALALECTATACRVTPTNP